MVPVVAGSRAPCEVLMTGAERVAIDVEAVTAEPASDAFLSVRDLQVQFPTEDGIVQAVNGINLDLARGQTLGIVGESGSGQVSDEPGDSWGCPRAPAREVTGSITLDGQDLVRASEADMRKLRGDVMSMIFQDPLSSMHPFYRVGDQIPRPTCVHNHVGKKAARRRRS